MKYKITPLIFFGFLITLSTMLLIYVGVKTDEIHLQIELQGSSLHGRIGHLEEEVNGIGSRISQVEADSGEIENNLKLIAESLGNIRDSLSEIEGAVFYLPEGAATGSELFPITKAIGDLAVGQESMLGTLRGENTQLGCLIKGGSLVRRDDEVRCSFED